MIRSLTLFTSLVLLVGCSAKSSGVAPGASDAADVQSGAPESVLPDSAGSADDAATGAADAFVRTTFDAHAASMVRASCAPGKLRLTLDGVLFDFDHDNLQPGGDDVLMQVKKASADAYPSTHIVVEGHTDNVGSDAHNDDLSTRRAKTVVTWMQAHGVDASRLAAKGYGKRWPRVPNTTDANRAKNRRVELIVLDQVAAESCKRAAGAPGPSGNGAMKGGGIESGRPDDGHSHYNGTPPPPNNPQTPVAFSFHYNDKADQKDHMCFSFDPAWVPPGSPPMGYLKKDFSVHDGDFVDHCPTENVVATCDRRGVLPLMEWYYQGTTEAKIALWKQLCTGKFVRIGAAAPIAKLAADTTHTYVGACDLRQATSGKDTCIEYRSDADPSWFALAKKTCTNLLRPRCPIEGATGRCDRAGVVTFYYMQGDAAQTNVGLRAACEQLSGSWSQP